MFPLKQRKLIRGFQAHISAGLGGAADYEADYETLYLPYDGIVSTYFEKTGGNWLRLVRPNGDQLEFAHLDQYFIKPGVYKAGTLVARTGNTGQITTGPHLHVQIFVNFQRVDPETYFKENPMSIEYPVAFIHAPGSSYSTLQEEFRQRVEGYTAGLLKLAISDHTASFTPPVTGNLGTDQAVKVINSLGVSLPQGCGIFILYPRNPDSVYEVAGYYPEKNVAFATVPNDQGSDIYVHALLHCIRKYLNFNHIGPYIEDVEHYYPLWEFQSQYDQLIPYFPLMAKNLMTEQEVTWEYNLAFYRDPTPEELAFWSGKPWAEFLKTAIKDRATFLAQAT